MTGIYEKLFDSCQWKLKVLDNHTLVYFSSSDMVQRRLGPVNMAWKYDNFVRIASCLNGGEPVTFSHEDTYIAFCAVDMVYFKFEWVKNKSVWTPLCETPLWTVMNVVHCHNLSQRAWKPWANAYLATAWRFTLWKK